MRSILVLSLAATAFAAPSNLAEWGNAVSRWGSWFESASPVTSILDSIRVTDDDRNIYDMLKASSEYTRLMKLVDMNKDVVDLLKTNNKRITFFATNNDALPHQDEDLINLIMRSGGGGGEKDPDNRKQRFREMVREIMLYHILPEDIDSNVLPNNSTVATELKADDGSFGGYRRRMKVDRQLLPPALKLNNYATVLTTYRAKNGIVHQIDRPLFPPPDIMDALFLFPQSFSHATSALLKTDLEDQLEFNSRHSQHGKHFGQWPVGDIPQRNHTSKMGYAATTFFAPTNDAFNKLPNDLLAFLFSPYGEKALRKLMEFHTIPDYAVYTEWIRHIETNENDKGDRRSRSAWFSDDEISVDEELQTLAKQKLPIHIRKTKSKIPGMGYNWEFKVHGIDVESRDNVAQNGAIQVVGTVLCPRRKGATDAGTDERDWNEWEHWLIDWVRNE